jgi:hypothetical protein
MFKPIDWLAKFLLHIANAPGETDVNLCPIVGAWNNTHRTAGFSIILGAWSVHSILRRYYMTCMVTAYEVSLQPPSCLYL